MLHDDDDEDSDTLHVAYIIYYIWIYIIEA